MCESVPAKGRQNDHAKAISLPTGRDKSAKAHPRPKKISKKALPYHSTAPANYCIILTENPRSVYSTLHPRGTEYDDLFSLLLFFIEVGLNRYDSII